MTFPSICPEVPVRDLAEALPYYRDRLDFTIDWSDTQLGLAGLSRDDARIFLADAAYRSGLGNQAPVVLWINLANRGEVDVLHDQWATVGVTIAAPPKAKPYRLYEFFAQDVDANILRIFYDFGQEDG